MQAYWALASKDRPACKKKLLTAHCSLFKFQLIPSLSLAKNYLKF